MSYEFAGGGVPASVGPAGELFLLRAEVERLRAEAGWLERENAELEDDLEGAVQRYTQQEKEIARLAAEVKRLLAENRDLVVGW